MAEMTKTILAYISMLLIGIGMVLLVLGVVR